VSWDLEDERNWYRDKLERGWELPNPALWPFRLPVIRTVRGTWHAWRVRRAARMFGEIGIGFGVPNQRDLWVIYAIHRGWC
jgi:hypothetical protein